MKAIIEFNLPEEEGLFQRAVAGSKAISLLHDLAQELRTSIKHTSGGLRRSDVEAMRAEIYAVFPDLDEL
jgi:hypothetical protein